MTNTPKPSENSSSKQRNEIPVIKAKDPGAKDTQFKFDEVQDAMKAGQAFADNTGMWHTSQRHLRPFLTVSPVTSKVLQPLPNDVQPNRHRI